MRKQDARDIAVSAITAFRKRNAWSDGYLRNKIRECELSKKDAALATEIVNGVLQNSLLINYYISKFSSVKFNKISPGIIDILQVAVYQILFLDRVPDSAAVNDAVNRAKRNNVRAAGFVNAITRKISAQKNNLPEIDGDLITKLSIKFSHPVWLVEKLIKVFGADQASEILKSNNEKADNVIRINSLKISNEDFFAKEAEGLTLKKGLVEGSAYVENIGNMLNNEAFLQGLFHVQDTASQVAALTLAPQRDAQVLDACSAPGGKSFLMAQIMNNTGSIVSCDIHEHKLALIQSGVDRLGIKNISTMLCDASEFKPEFENKFDFVLADVPCSGLGIIRKKPDIRYKDGEEIKNLPEIQLKILKNVSRYVKNGGYLLYSTCTILPEENSDIVEQFLLENKNFEESVDYMEIGSIKNKFGITLLPHLSNTDGFYMCRLRRKK